MAISMKEILKGTKLEEQDKVVQENLTKLLEKANKLRTAYGKPLLVSSGLRSMKDHLRIYAEKGITDKSKIPMKSKHLSGEALDFADPKKELQTWIKDNVKLMEEIGLWMEDFSATETWVHIQTVPPKSGNRFFKP